MDWSAATWWWIASGVLVAAELATSTVYLLMIARGAAAAVGVRGAILRAAIGIGFDDTARDGAFGGFVDQDFADHVARDREHRTGVKGAGQGAALHRPSRRPPWYTMRLAR